MNLQFLQQIDPSFDPAKHSGMPFSSAKLFDANQFTDSETHQLAEKTATELIRASLSKRAGGKPVYSRDEIVFCRGSRRGTEIFDAIAKGDAVVR